MIIMRLLPKLSLAIIFEASQEQSIDLDLSLSSSQHRQLEDQEQPLFNFLIRSQSHPNSLSIHMGSENPIKKDIQRPSNYTKEVIMFSDQRQLFQKHQKNQDQMKILQYNQKLLEYKNSLLVQYQQAIKDKDRDSKMLRLKLLNNLASRSLEEKEKNVVLNEERGAQLKRKPYSRISHEQRSIINQMLQNRVSIKQIAQRTGVSKSSIKLIRLKLMRK